MWLARHKTRYHKMRVSCRPVFLKDCQTPPLRHPHKLRNNKRGHGLTYIGIRRLRQCICRRPTICRSKSLGGTRGEADCALFCSCDLFTAFVHIEDKMNRTIEYVDGLICPRQIKPTATRDSVGVKAIFKGVNDRLYVSQT